MNKKAFEQLSFPTKVIVILGWVASIAIVVLFIRFIIGNMY